MAADKKIKATKIYIFKCKLLQNNICYKLQYFLQYYYKNTIINTKYFCTVINIKSLTLDNT